MIWWQEWGFHSLFGSVYSIIFTVNLRISFDLLIWHFSMANSRYTCKSHGVVSSCLCKHSCSFKLKKKKELRNNLQNKHVQNLIHGNVRYFQDHGKRCQLRSSVSLCSKTLLNRRLIDQEIYLLCCSHRLLLIFLWL